jgi:hypothetical protein
LYVADASIFQRAYKQSCYFGKLILGYSADWVFDMQDGRITRVGKGGTDTSFSDNKENTCHCHKAFLRRCHAEINIVFFDIDWNPSHKLKLYLLQMLHDTYVPVH